MNEHLNTIEGSDTVTTHTAGRAKRRLGTKIISGLLVTGSLVMGLGLASATAPTSAGAATTTNKVGQYTAPTCGWYRQYSELYDRRVVQSSLPWVTGTTTASQLIWDHVEFVKNNATYASAWFYTYAVAGRWTGQWMTQSGVKGQTAVHDNGESGYTNVASDALVRHTILWMTGTATTGQLSWWATSSNSTQNPHVCNGGPWMY